MLSTFLKKYAAPVPLTRPGVDPQDTAAFGADPLGAAQNLLGGPPDDTGNGSEEKSTQKPPGNPQTTNLKELPNAELKTRINKASWRSGWTGDTDSGGYIGKATGFVGSASKTTKPIVGEGHMANEKKSAREALREKLAVLVESKKASQYGRLREVAKKAPGKVGEALGELAHSAGIMATSFAALKENLDLNEPPRAASLRARVAARKKYAVEFRRIAEASPEQLADSVIELYRSLDEIVSGIENFATNLGIELPGPEEEMLDANLGGGDGDEGLHGEMPIGRPEGLPEEPADNPLEAKGERLESDAEQATEEAEGAEGTEADLRQDEELAKAAAGEGFTDDRDEDAKPKAPDKVKNQVSEGKKATGAGFTTNRDQNAEPKPVEKAEIPVSEGEAHVRLSSLRNQAGW